VPKSGSVDTCRWRDARDRLENAGGTLIRTAVGLFKSKSHTGLTAED